MTFRLGIRSLVLAGCFILAGALAGCGKVAEPQTEVPLPPTLTSKSGVEMVVIPAGWFSMGSTTGKPEEQPRHSVWVDSFLMDKHEVTQADWEKMKLPSPSHFKGPTLPVEQISWTQAARYCNARSKADGLEPCYNEDTAECDFNASGYRLPTESEWEYACRAGNEGEYSFGNDERGLGEYAWFADNAEKKTHPVGQKRPNAWGLHDMHGNVAEWCHDNFDKAYYGQSPEKNPRGPAEGDRNVLRGGAWNSPAAALRSAARVGESPGFQDACFARDAIGFRCVRRAPEPQPAGKK